METRKLLLISKLLIFLMISLGIMSSCQKERLESLKPPVVDTTTIPLVKIVAIHAVAGAGGTISPVGDTSVISGDSITYNIIPDRNYRIKTITINGVDQEISDSLVVKTSNELNVWNIDISFTFNESIALLSKGTWYLQKFEEQYFTTGDSVWYLMKSMNPADSIYYYHYDNYSLDGYWRSYDLNGGFIGGPYEYYLKDNILEIKGCANKFTITTMNEETLVFQFLILGCDSVKGRETYSHNKR
jgi:hypothetical protein